MRRFIKIVVLFTLPIILVLCVHECGMRSVPNDYKYKNTWLENNISSVQIWIFGSSHGLYGVNPHYLSGVAFNSAHVSQSLKYDAYIFNKFIDRADSLQWIILPISYFSLFEDLEDGVEWWRVKNYCIYYQCPYHMLSPKYRFELIGNPLPFKDQVFRIWNYYTKGDNDLHCDSFGFDTNFSKENRSENWWMDGTRKVRNHTYNIYEKKSTTYEHKAYVENIIRKCEIKNVNVLLLTTPVCESYYQIVNETQYELMTSFCIEMAEKYTQVHYLNTFKDERFSKNDFFDSDHLETEGACKLSNILDDYIKKNSMK